MQLAIKGITEQKGLWYSSKQEESDPEEMQSAVSTEYQSAQARCWHTQGSFNKSCKVQGHEGQQ